jgi:hypothetical protein
MGSASNLLIRQYLAAHPAAPPAKDEAYVLRAGPAAVVVAGSDDAGAFYALGRSLADKIARPPCVAIELHSETSASRFPAFWCSWAICMA